MSDRSALSLPCTVANPNGMAPNTSSTPVSPRHLVTACAAYANRESPHQAWGNQPPATVGPPGDHPAPAGAVVCDEPLGGLVKHYRRAA